MLHSAGLNFHSHECVRPSGTIISSKSTCAACPLTWRQSSGRLTHAGRHKVYIVIPDPGLPLLLQLLLDLINLLCKQVIVLSLPKKGQRNMEKR